MKHKHILNIKKRATIFSLLLIMVAFLLSVECNIKFPKNITIFEGENLLVGSSSPYTLSTPANFGGVLDEKGNITKDIYSDKKYVKVNNAGNYNASVKLFGVIPVRDVNINVSETKTLIPCGDAIGIKLFTKGLVCVGTSDIADIKGTISNPAALSDIKIGDIILSANGKTLKETEEFSKIISNSDGAPIEIVTIRNEKESKKIITPIQTADGYKLGIWVRDSTAGIGTLSFIDPKTHSYGALGHPICDSDTGTLMPVSKGSLADAEIFGIEKGEKGNPGELKGTFSSQGKDIGTIEKNTICGIYGKFYDSLLTDEKAIPISSKNNIKKGEAQIISNISGDEKEYFDVEIQHISSFSSNDNKNMIIKVTDERLLEKTGGIVQGMSGSPIIQNDKLIGAVTHVFVNDPTRGYGIFIENMLTEVEN